MEASFNPLILKHMVKKAATLTGKPVHDVLSDIGITPTAYYSYVNRKRLPDLLTLSKLAKYFRVSRDAFFEDEDEDKPGGGGGVLQLAPSLADVPARRRRGLRVAVAKEQMQLLSQRIEELQDELRQALVLLKGRGVALSGRVAVWLHDCLHPGLAFC